MNLNLSGHHVEITPAIRSYILAKLERTQRHSERIIGASIIISVEKLVKRIEVLMHLSGRDVFLRVEDNDLYSAIDCMADKLDRQVLRIKEKTYRNRTEKEGRRPISTEMDDTTAPQLAMS